MILPIIIDVRRTELQHRFFERYAGSGTSRDVLAAVAATETDVPALIESDDCVRYGYAGWSYWLLYILGYLEHLELGSVARDNVYARYFVDHYLPGPHDPGLRGQLLDEASALARVGARFADLHRLLGPGRGDAAVAAMLPVRVLASSRRQDDLHDVFDASSGVSVKAQAIDGWHRLFAARLGEVPSLPGVVRLDDATWTASP